MTVNDILSLEEVMDFRQGKGVSVDLARVLEESGDPAWTELLLRRFKDRYYCNDLAGYYDFADIVATELNVALYNQENKKRILEAAKLKEWNLGRPLTLDEELEIVDGGNHASRDFRLYYILEHPEACALESRRRRIPSYMHKIEWLLINAEIVDPEQKPYTEILRKNTEILESRINQSS